MLETREKVKEKEPLKKGTMADCMSDLLTQTYHINFSNSSLNS